MSVIRVCIDSPESGSSIKDLLNLKSNDSTSLVFLGSYLEGIAGGTKTGKVRINTSTARASGTFTFSSFVADDTVTLNGVTLTGKASPSGASQWAVGATDQACANNLVTKLNASALDLIVGVVSASRRATALLSSFADADTVTINSVVFTGKTTPTVGVREEFAIGGSDSITAQNLLDAINRSLFPNLVGISGSRSTATLTLNFPGTLTVSASAHATVTSTIVVVTSIVGGQIGNLCTLAISAHGSVSAAALTGGTEGTEVIVGNNYTSL